MFRKKNFEDILNREKLYAMNALKRNDITGFNNAFTNIINICLKLRTMERAIEIKRELYSLVYLK